MRVALLDPFAGVSGDMFVGALLDAGASFAALKRGLAALQLKGYTLSSRRVMRGGVSARKFGVRHREDHHHRGLPEILRMLRRLPPGARDRASAAFTLLGEAEARIHGIPVAKVHFHEVGAIDSICDIAGAALALNELEIEAIHARPLPLSSGTVDAAHGRMPIPAPATMELLKGRRTYDSGLFGELVTPTGAAMVAAWSTDAAIPPFTPSAIGYGAGDRDPEGYPNVCRITVGECHAAAPGPHLLELVCDVDDASPQILGHLLARLLEAGALDATLQPLIMKKDRPGTRVSALAPPPLVPALEEILFREGTTLGVRRRAVERTELPRRIVRVKTPHGVVRVKIAELGGKVVHVAPEFEDCRALARKSGVPLPEILRQAVARWSR